MAIDRRRLQAAAAGAVIALLLTGCGGNEATTSPKESEQEVERYEFLGESGSHIFHAALDDMEDVKALSYQGTMARPSETTSLDVRTDHDGRCTGTMSQGPKTGTATFVSTPKATFLKGDRTFWKNSAGEDPSEFLANLKGRWMKTPADQRISGVCSLAHGLIRQLNAADAPVMDKGEVTQFEGHEVIPVSEGSAERKTGSVEILVSVSEPHYIYRIILSSPETKIRLTLSDLDASDPIALPVAGEYLDAR